MADAGSEPVGDGTDGSETGTGAAAAVDGLRTAAEELAAARDARERLPVDPDRVDAVADAYREVDRLLERYEERATDWDDFEGYVEFRENLSRQVASLPEDLPHRDRFEAVDTDLKTGAVAETLSTDDFAAARDELAPVRECADVSDRLATAREEYRRARRSARDCRGDLQARIDDLERLASLGEADLDAPVERLREPITAYDSAVREAFDGFHSEASARDLLGLIERTAAYPLVSFERPPDRLLRFVTGAAAGTEPIGTLLEYADYSRSKLAHYVDDPGELKGAVSTTRTYLRELSADPLLVEWPPPPADRLRWRARERVAVVGRFADESVVARAREVRRLADRNDYVRLRESAVARAELDDRQRERVASGAVAEELAATRDRLERVETTLEEHPPFERV